MIVVNTFYTRSYAPLAAIVLPNLISYCKKHGYHYMINEVQDENFHFIKVKDARKLLDGWRTVFSIELDTLVTNHSIKIESFLEDTTKDLILTKDINGVNSGVMVMRSTKWMKDLLDEVIRNENNYGDEQNFFETFNHEKIKYCDHPAFNSILYKEYTPSYGYINWESIQPPPVLPMHEQGNWQPGDFVCHLPGKSLFDRIAIFQELQKQIIL